MEAPYYPPDSTTSVAYTESDIPTISLPDDNPDPYYSYPSRSPAEITLERQWNDLSALYSANETMKSDAAKLDPASTSARDISSDGDTAQKLDDLLDAFMSGANSVLEELTFLGSAHPALAIAIFAFHEVVKLDIARRDNNKKVLVVVLQMQSMMGPMFQLRNLNRSHMPEPERQFHETRLSETVELIARDIKMCRSDIAHFMNRKFVYKLVLAKGYEKKFANHMETFARRRAELQSVISEYIAIGISTANIAISQVGAKVDSVDVKLDQIISTLFRNLDTPREKDVFKFIQLNGGPEKCVSDQDLLPKLVAKAGESPKTGKVAISDQAELEELQKLLSEALKEDLDKVLEKHYSRFEKVLQVQSNNLKRMSSHLEDQGVLMQTHTTKLGKILDTVTTIMVLEEGKFKTKEVKLKDPEIHDVWTRMNLGTSSVKAKVFVLTFRDHIRAENSTMGTPIQETVALPPNEGESNLLQPSPPSKEDSEWVFEYIDVAYVQPIIEAMDEDGSGFISVKEANSFALSRDRPKDMKLLSWVAYWAAGWHINLIKYQKDIYSILLQMHEALPSIHVANRTYVDDFLDETAMRRVEALCRSLKPLPDTHRKDPKLLAVASEVASWQLDRLKTNLTDMGYAIESSSDAMTISGSVRVETWIFPLLYLLLQRYLEIINIAKTVVLDTSEFESHIASLTSIFSVFDERMESLEAKFSQLHRDVDAQFHNFSYGMFYAAYKKNELDTSLNTLLTLKIDEYTEQKDTPVKGKGPPDTSILSKPVGKVLELDDLNLLPPSPAPPEHIPHPIEGNWFGWSSWNGSNRMRPHRCVIHPVVDNKLVGKGEAFFGAIDFAGTISTDPESEKIKVQFEFIPAQSDWRSQVCEGFYDPVRDTIEGTFEWKDEDQEPAPATDTEAVTVAPTQEAGAEASEPADVEQKDAEEAKGNEATAVNDVEGETNDKGVIVVEGISSNEVAEIPTDSARNDDTQSPINKTPPETENSTDVAPTEASSEVKEEQPSAGTDTAEKSLNEDAPIVATDNPTVPVTDGEAETTQAESAEKAEVKPDPVDEAEEEEEEDKEPDTRFYLTRTPPHAFRFRPLLDGPGPAPCWGAWPLWRKRWAFATESVLHETRLRMWSKKAVAQALAERRQWVYHSMRYDLTDSNITARWWRFDSFTDKEWDTYDALITAMQPDAARMWEEIAHFKARRQTYIVGRLVCDLCTKLIAFCRYQCIVCMRDDLSSSIDLCQNCFDKPEGVLRGVSDNFSHLPSHSLLRSQNRIHSYEVNNLIPAARLTSERCKKMFKDLEDAKKDKIVGRGTKKIVKGKGSKRAPAENTLLERLTPAEPLPIFCTCCNKDVSLPCWVCLECSPLAFICMSCDRKNAHVNQAEHKVLEHHLLLIHDSVEVKSIKAAKGSDVERQLDDINTSIAALDKKVNQQLEEAKEMKLVVEDVAETMGLKDYDLASGVDWEEGQEPATLDAEVVAEPDDSASGPQEEGELAEEEKESQPVESETDKPDGDSKPVAGPADDPGGARLVVQQPNLRERLAALETRVDSILTHLSQDDRHAALGRKMDALETKMDQQFGTLLALMQNFTAAAGASRPTPNGTIM